MSSSQGKSRGDCIAAQGREVVTVHECAECGYIEGESPQAGCCPRCGIKSDAIPMKVRRV